MNKMIHFGIPLALPGLQNEKNEQNDSFRHAFYKKIDKMNKTIHIDTPLLNPVFNIDAHVHQHFECQYLLK